MKTTRHCDVDVMQDRSYLRPEWIEGVLQSPVQVQQQADGRFRFWGFVPELGKYLRVVTLEDRETVHTACPDRRFKEDQP